MPKSMTRLAHWFAYAAPTDALKKRGVKPPRVGTSIHMTRDGAACFRLLSALGAEYQAGDILLNFPPSEYGPKFKAPETPPINSDDLIILTTRPPITSLAGDDDEKILESGTDLERSVIDALKAFFEYTERGYVKLANGVIDGSQNNNATFADRDLMKFQIKKRATYISGGTLPSDLTAGFLAYVPNLKYLKSDERSLGEPALLAAFSLNGPCTQAWIELLHRNDFELPQGEKLSLKELVTGDRPRLIIGEFAPVFDDNELPSTSSNIVEDWPVEIIIDVKL